MQRKPEGQLVESQIDERVVTNTFGGNLVHTLVNECPGKTRGWIGNLDDLDDLDECSQLSDDDWIGIRGQV